MSAAYRRVLLKLSGEALMGKRAQGIDTQTVRKLADDMAAAVAVGAQIAVVIGGGNLVRGKGLEGAGIERVTADHMGMLATLINALALQDAIEQHDINCRVMSAIPVPQICESYIRRRAMRHLEKGRLVIFAAGTGSPFFTTDSAASLRAVEIDADILFKATKVDGVYSGDPMTDADAQRFEQIHYDEVLTRKLEVMDSTALVLCRDHRMLVRVFNVFEPGALVRAIQGEAVGTLVDSEAAHA